VGLIPSPEMLDPLTQDQAAVVERFRSRLGDAIVREHSFRKQLMIWIRRQLVLEALRFAKSEPTLDCALLSDLTCVDLLGFLEPGEPRFEVVYNLYSLKHSRRFLLKTKVNEGEPVASATSVWPGANYMEREVFDLFGIVFEGHPNLERILTPDGWLGHPLRKDQPTRTDQFPNVES
jgi:NADH-quinone oxidoreductase subunit C